MLDAYSLRKAVPRLVVAVIAINLSIYLCLAAVDITNIVGRGLGQLLTAPFITADSYDFGIKSNVSNSLAVAGSVGIFVGAGGLAAATGALFTLAAAPLATLGAILLLMIPIALIAVGVMATIVIRQALLVFLIIVSPIAIACSVLPGTEKYFQQWWNIFLKTLIVYPIITAIFAMSDVFGSIIFNSAEQGNGASGVIKIITGIIVIYAPLAMIPFAFRLAGGVIGQVANIASAGAKRISDFGPIKGRREVAKQQLQHGSIQQRAEKASWLQDRASRSGRLGRAVYSRGAKAVGGYNVEALASAARAQKAEELNKQIATGRDEEIRGLTVNKRTADNDAMKTIVDDDGYTYSVNKLRRLSKDGSRQYKTLGGAWVNEAQVDAGQSRWGRDQFAQQAALSYEMRKANTADDAEGIKSRYMNIATEQGGWGLSTSAAAGNWIGAAFENQNQNLSYKYTDVTAEGGPQLKGAELAAEIYEKRGSYPLSQMSADTINQLREAHRVGDDPTKQRVAAIAQSFMSRYGGGESMAGVDESGNPIPGTTRPPTSGATQGVYQTNTQGSAAVAEAVRQLAVETGVYRPLDPSTDTQSATDGTQGRPRQN